MFINIAARCYEPNNVEILDVLNEVSLNERYSKSWDKEIIVDVLLITEKGDIVVEINYKNPKNWRELKPYYKELDLLRVFEVKVDKYINSKLEWSFLGEEDEINRYEEEQIRLEIEEAKERREKKKRQKKERERRKEEKERKHIEHENKMIKEGKYVECKIYINHKNELEYHEESKSFTLTCLYNAGSKGYKRLDLRFNTRENLYTKRFIENNFEVTQGILECTIIVDKHKVNGYHNVSRAFYSMESDYNKRLYAQLCQLEEY